MEFRILGPLTLIRDGQEIQVSGAKARTVLALLLLRVRRLVTSDALIEELWRDRPPPSATNTLQTYISQLRQLIEPHRRPGTRSKLLRTLPGGYLLEAQPSQVDAESFERNVAEGQESLAARDFVAAAHLLRSGLELWRGPALANVRGVTVEREAARLEELRLVALELRFEADLALGRHRELVGELEPLASEHPARERLTAQLMLALYRSNRQTDALAKFRTARERMANELGASPSPELQVLERRILRQDPGLDADAPAPVADPRPSPVDGERGAPTEQREPPGAEAARTPRAPRRRVVALSATALLIVALLGALLVRQLDRLAEPEVSARFQLAVSPGIGYDLDLSPQEPSGWDATNAASARDYPYLDLYRTSVKAPRDWISGVDPTNTDAFNAVHLLSPSDGIDDCRTLRREGGGNVALGDLEVGSKVCLRTHEDRWALLTVMRMPERRAELLFLEVELAAP